MKGGQRGPGMSLVDDARFSVSNGAEQLFPMLDQFAPPQASRLFPAPAQFLAWIFISSRCRLPPHAHCHHLPSSAIPLFTVTR